MALSIVVFGSLLAAAAAMPSNVTSVGRSRRSDAHHDSQRMFATDGSGNPEHLRSTSNALHGLMMCTDEAAHGTLRTPSVLYTGTAANDINALHVATTGVNGGNPQTISSTSNALHNLMLGTDEAAHGTLVSPSVLYTGTAANNINALHVATTGVSGGNPETISSTSNALHNLMMGTDENAHGTLVSPSILYTGAAQGNINALHVATTGVSGGNPETISSTSNALHVNVQNSVISTMPGLQTGTQMVYGWSTDIDTAIEMIWDEDFDGGLAYTGFVATAALPKVSSLSIEDDFDKAPAGTGARTLKITGIDNSNALVSCVIQMDGTTEDEGDGTVGCNVVFRRFIKAEVDTVGSTGAAVGQITIKIGTVVVGHIAAGKTRTHNAHGVVPAGQTGFVSYMMMKAVHEAQFTCYYRLNDLLADTDKPDIIFYESGTISAGVTHEIAPRGYGFGPFPALADIWCGAKGTAADSDVTVYMMIDSYSA